MSEKLSPWNKDWTKITQNEENLFFFKELAAPYLSSSVFWMRGRRSEVTCLAFTPRSNAVFPSEDALAVWQSLQNSCPVLASHIPGTSPRVPTALPSHCKAENTTWETPLCISEGLRMLSLWISTMILRFDRLCSPGGELSLRWISDFFTGCFGALQASSPSTLSPNLLPLTKRCTAFQ